jgi:hypothetical protein
VKRLALLAALAAPVALGAQWDQVQLDWSSPTRFADGSLIPSTSTISYNLYAARKGETKTVIVSGIKDTGMLRTGIPVGEWCWQLTAVVGGVESDRSAEVCKRIAQPVLKPQPPVLSIRE